jgi:hypothetical protein
MQKVKHKAFLGLFSFLWPFGGLIYSIKNWNSEYVKNTIWWFCIYFGSVFIYIFGDSQRYALSLAKYSDFSFSEIIDVIYNILDGYVPLVSYFLSKITVNPQFLFIILAVVFGFFYSRNLYYVFSRVNKKSSKNILILLFLYALINPIWNINIVRFFTAAHIFVYGAMPYICEKKRSKLLWILVSAFIHWSFILPIIFLLLWIIVPKKLSVFFYFYIVSLFINTIDFNFIDLSAFGDYGSRIGIYVNNKAISEYQINISNVNWHVKVSKSILYWVIQGYIIYLYFVIKKYFKNNESIINLYTFSLLIYGTSNLFVTFNFPEAYRFVVLSLLFVMPLIILTVSHIKKKSIQRKFYRMSIPLLFTIIFKIRTGFEFYGITLVLGNYISAIFVKDNTPIIEFVKNLF